MVQAHGNLAGDEVLVTDPREASRLQDKGAFGTRRQTGLALDLFEASYLVETERLEVRHGARGEGIDLAALVALGSRDIGGFETLYLAYRDLRSRGFVLRAREHADFDAWTRGGAPPAVKPSTLVAARPESAALDPRALARLLSEVDGLGRKLLVSVVDEESDVTYYDVGAANLSGTVRDPAARVAPKAKATLLSDRAVVRDDPGLRDAGYGNVAGGQLFLSLAEAHHLAAAGLEIEDLRGRHVSADDIRKTALALHLDAAEAFDAYTWLRRGGLVPKTGFKFGVHFRAYKDLESASHAPFLVHALADSASWTLRDLARFVRLAHGVKKRAVLWSRAGAVMLTWVRP